MTSMSLSRRGLLGATASIPVAIVGCRAKSWIAEEKHGSAGAVVKLSDFDGGAARGDNTGAMAAAITSVIKSGGGIVQIDAGVHRFASSALGQQGIVVPSGVTFRGAGRGETVLKVDGTAVCNLFVALNANDIGFEDMSIVGNNVSAPVGSVYGIGSAVRWALTGDATTGASGFVMRRVHLENFRGPRWVEIQNGASVASRDMHSIVIKDVTFMSKPGNSISPGDRKINSAVICINGDVSAVRDIQVSAVEGDARYIKTGIILYQHVVGARLDKLKIRNAGRFGATDHGAAYAIQLYDTYYRMSSIEVVDPVVESPRSVGIYVAGGTDISILNARISGQTDQRSETLPKGGVVFNGTRRWTLKGATLRNNWRDLDIAVPNTGNAITSQQIDGLAIDIDAEGSANGVMIRHAAGRIAAGISFKNCRWRTTMRTVLVQNGEAPTGAFGDAARGYIDDIRFEACELEAANGHRAIELTSNAGTPAGGYIVSKCHLIGSNPLFAQGYAGLLKIEHCFVRDRGTTSGAAAATLIDCGQLDLSYSIFDSPGRDGIGIALGGSVGSVKRVQFQNCVHTLPSAHSGQLGQEVPRFLGHKGQYVQNLNPGLHSYQGWICLGGRRWVGTDQPG